MNSPEPESTPQSPSADADIPEQVLQPWQASAEPGLPVSPALPPAEQLPPHVHPVGHPAGPADSGSPLRWADLLYLLLFYFVAGELLTLAVAGGAAVVYHIPFSQLQDLGGPGAAVAVVSQALLSFATLAFLYVLVRVRTGAPFWPSVGWREFRGIASRTATTMRYVFLGFGLALVVSGASKFVDTGKTLPMEELFRNRQTVVMLMVLGILVAPFIEETLFRGCLYPVIARSFGMPAGIVATGIVFGLAHAPQLWGGWGQIALLMGVGMVLTYIRARAGTVAASYLVHVSYNSILFAGLFFATGGLRHFPTT
jgi:membrane protease YdiL (CAAX protease family)